MGNRARRRVWAHRVTSDSRLTDFHRHLAMTVADMDRRGFDFYELGGELFFKPKPQYAASFT
jgi:hypothetical protein